MTDNKHTPGKAVWDGGMSIDVGQWNILTLNTYAPEIENFEANAERIVTCWNEYDQLKAELEAAKQREAKLREALEVAHTNIRNQSVFLSDKEWQQITEALNQ